MKIAMIASEASPFIKSGGLGDVLGSLPKALQREKQKCFVILPKYKDLAPIENLSFITSFFVWVGWRKQYCGVFETKIAGVTFYFIDNEQYFKREGLYGYDDDYERFAFYNLAAMELIGHLKIQPDIIHLHDWQTSMIALLYKEKYYRYPYYENIKIIFTIHNIAYQGKGNPIILEDIFGLDIKKFDIRNCLHDGCLNMMKTAIVYSDVITTVSPTYAKGILTKEFGEGLESILQLRKNDIFGIINGIDTEYINPKTNIDIVENYDGRNFYYKKSNNKIALQKECLLPVNKDIACIGMVTRLTWQKGINLIINKIEELLNREIQIFILGAGEYQYEQQLLYLQKQYPNQLSYHQKYDEKLAQRIYASCDIFLMPSLFEPCGLSQMMAMRYGTIPIVREIGGLKDSIEAYNAYEQTGNGFRFINYDGNEMLSIIDMALSVYYDDKKVWKKIMRSAMQSDFSWKHSAKEYISLYQKLINKER
ncbi:MAG: glycogen synthase GlgA [Coprobacillaceae bacterium]